MQLSHKFVNNGRVRATGIEISVSHSTALSEGLLCAGCPFFSSFCPVFIGEERTRLCFRSHEVRDE